jgi:predicted DNA-binding transcriptional regulator AlpA
MTALVGMKEISRYTSRSEATILALIRDADFPAVKIRGGWESDSDLIDTWRREQIRLAQERKKSTKRW